MKKSTFLHLRIPFSFFLMPVFLFAWAVFKDSSSLFDVVLMAIILHIFLYPASNGYNSYFDKDEESIGGLRNPPKVDRELYLVSLLFDLVALLIGFYFGWEFVLMLLVYGLVSKAYSHPSIRLKKLPIIGWVAAGVFQGYFTFLMVLVGLQQGFSEEIWSHYYQFPALLSTALLFGSYPMTQIYQHEEDNRRGDMTISRMLGIFGTFHFTATAFAVSTTGYVYYYSRYFSVNTSFIFMVCLSPVLVYFGYWYVRARRDLTAVNYDHTMRLNALSAIMLNLFFLYLGLA